MLVAGCDEKRRRIRAASATQRQALAADRASTMNSTPSQTFARMDASATARIGAASTITKSAWFSSSSIIAVSGGLVARKDTYLDLAGLAAQVGALTS